MSNDIVIKLVVQSASGKKEIKEFNTSLDSLGTEAKKAGQAAGGSFKNLFANAKKYLGVAGVAGLVLTVTQTVRAGYRRMMDRGAEFESSLAELSAITGIAGQDLESLSKNALETSKQWGRSAADIIEANKLVASQLAEKIDFGTAAGMEELQEVSREAIVLSQAAGIDLATAVQTTTTAINQFNLEASETNRIINSVAAGAKFGAAEAQAQSEAYREAGSVFAAANREFEELNASTQVLAANAITGSRAGTGLRNIMTILQSEADKLAKFGIHNLNVENETFAQTLGRLKPLLGDTAALAEIFGRENLTAAQILIQNADAVESMTEKVTGTNTAYQQAEVRLDTYDGAMSKLQATIDGVLIPAFQRNAGVYVKLINLTADMVEAIGAVIEQMNKWADQHYDLRRDLSLSTSETNAQIDAMRDLRNELAKAAIAGNLTAEQEAELRDVFDETTQRLKNRIEALGDEEAALYSRKLELQDIIATSKNFEQFNEAKKELEGVELSIAANTAQMQQLRKAVQDAGGDFDLFVESVRKANQELSAAPDEGEGTGGLPERIKNMREEYQALVQSGELSPEEMVRVEWLNMQIQKYEELVAKNKELGQARSDEISIEADLIALQDEEAQRQRQAHSERMDQIDAEKAAVLTAEAQKKAAADSYKKELKSLGVEIASNMAIQDNAAKAAIDAILAKVVAIAIEKAMESLPFPLNFAAAAGAAVAAKKLRNLIPGFATGGRIMGPGSDTSDSIPIRASRNEYMMNARSSRALGYSRLDRLNSDPTLARRMGAIMDRLPHLRGNNINLAGIEDALRTSRASGSGMAMRPLMDKLDQVAGVIASAERGVNFRLSEFHEHYTRFLENESIAGRR